MKILVFENQLLAVQPSFNSVNAIFFNESLQIDYFAKSQDLKPFKSIEEYDCVFVDISLAPNSKLDGIGILKRISEENLTVKKTIVLTGDSKISDKLKKYNLSEIPILLKPIDFNDLYEYIK